MPSITSARILILATHGYERSELRVPLEQLTAKGATVKIASLEKAPIKSWDAENWGDTVDVDLTVDEVKIDDFDALVIPGGQINPDLLRKEQKAVDLVKSFINNGWCVQIRGPQAGGAVTDLPIHLYDLGTGNQVKIPSEVMIPETREFEFANLGGLARLLDRLAPLHLFHQELGRHRGVGLEPGIDAGELEQVLRPRQGLAQRAKALIDAGRPLHRQPLLDVGQMRVPIGVHLRLQLVPGRLERGVVDGVATMQPEQREEVLGEVDAHRPRLRR